MDVDTYSFTSHMREPRLFLEHCQNSVDLSSKAPLPPCRLSLPIAQSTISGCRVYSPYRHVLRYPSLVERCEIRGILKAFEGTGRTALLFRNDRLISMICRTILHGVLALRLRDSGQLPGHTAGRGTSHAREALRALHIIGMKLGGAPCAGRQTGCW